VGELAERKGLGEQGEPILREAKITQSQPKAREKSVLFIPGWRRFFSLFQDEANNMQQISRCGRVHPKERILQEVGALPGDKQKPSLGMQQGSRCNQIFREQMELRERGLEKVGPRKLVVPKRVGLLKQEFWGETGTGPPEEMSRLS